MYPRRYHNSFHVACQGLRHFPSSNVCNSVQGKASGDLVRVLEVFPDGVDNEPNEFTGFSDEEGDGEVPLGIKDGKTPRKKVSRTPYRPRVPDRPDLPLASRCTCYSTQG